MYVWCCRFYSKTICQYKIETSTNDVREDIEIIDKRGEHNDHQTPSKEVSILRKRFNYS